MTRQSASPSKISGASETWLPPITTRLPRARNSRAILIPRWACETFMLIPTRSASASKSTGSMISSQSRISVSSGKKAATVAIPAAAVIT